MRRFALKQFDGKVLLAALLFLAAPVICNATCPDASNNAGYVRSGATGTGTGADWTNAYTAIPATLSRGCTYYVAAGTYGAYTFSTADSGTTIITVQAPTATNHGTSTGWNSSYVGQAVFTCSSSCSNIWNFTSDYWVINGAYRTDWTTGYGFHVSNVNGNAGGIANVLIGPEGGPYYHDITIAYVENEGSHPTSDSSHGIIYVFQAAGGSYDLLFDHTYAHDGYTGYFLKGNHGHPGGGGGYGPGNNITIQYSYQTRVYDSNAYHGEGCSCSEGLVNFTVRYNKFVNTTYGGGTATIATASGGGYASGNQNNGPWYIYGNLFYNLASGCGVGDATIDIFDASFNPGGDFWAVQNTYSNMGPNYCGGGQSGYAFGSGWHAQMSNVYVENELWYNSSGFVDGANGGTFTYTNFTSDYNQYYQMADSSYSADPGTHTSVTTSSNPFVSAAAYNFTLASDTAAGTTLSNVGTYWNGTSAAANTFNVDVNGTTRGTNGTWDRGAFQISGTSSQAPNPPTGLTATVQ